MYSEVLLGVMSLATSLRPKKPVSSLGGDVKGQLPLMMSRTGGTMGGGGDEGGNAVRN